LPYLSSNFLGPELPDIISSLVSLVCLTLFLKRWQPVRIFRFADMGASHVDQTLARTGYTAGQIVRAWSPFLFLTATVTLWSIPPFKALFAPGGALYDMVINISVPFLDKMVARMPPVVHDATPYAAVYKFDWFSATGTAILFAAILSVVWLRMKPAAAVQTFAAITMAIPASTTRVHSKIRTSGTSPRNSTPPASAMHGTLSCRVLAVAEERLATS
jgi:L-lactate permease